MNNVALTPPCRDCKERSIDCHGKCELYQAWVKVNRELRRKRQEEERLQRWRIKR